VPSERRGGLRIAERNVLMALFLRFFPATSMPSRKTATTTPRLPRLAFAMTDN
jgi:hypothetical protein